MVKDMVTSLRFVLGTLAACAVVYPGLLLAVGQIVLPAGANGSLIRSASGAIVGSRLIAQDFEHPAYLWPRPSAAGYDAAAAGGSNLAPSNPALAARAGAQLARLEASAARRVPAELIAASGSGLDPDITLEGALYQLDRIARARGVDASRVEEVLRYEASSGTPWSPRLINVLEANLALDRNLGQNFGNLAPPAHPAPSPSP